MSDDEKPTIELAKVPEWAIELTKSVKAGFAEVKADISLVANDVSIAKDRIGVIEGRVLVLEDARKNVSIRVRESQANDMQQDAQLAQERIAREELAAKVDKLLSIGERLEKVTKNPTAKVLAGMLATAAMTWLAARQAAPPQPVQQLAPVVIHADAGAP